MSLIRDQHNMGSKTDDSESSSIAPYNTFNSFTAEDSIEQIKKRNSDINGDPAFCQRPTELEELGTHWMMSKKVWKFIDISIVVVIIALVWVMMSLPTAFYINNIVTVS